MTEFRVLDPACGCGNFLYVAFMEMRRLEIRLIQKVYDNFNVRVRSTMEITSRLKPDGTIASIDVKPTSIS
jgi:hypothetical protein